MSSTASSPKILPDTSPGNLPSGSILASACFAFSRSFVLSLLGFPAPLRGLAVRFSTPAVACEGETELLRVGDDEREPPGVDARDEGFGVAVGVRTEMTSSSESEREREDNLGEPSDAAKACRVRAS